MVEDERLTHLGYAVVALAATGSEAIQQAPVHRPDLVPMDIRLQGPMDGIEAAAVIPYPP
jgi:CheY-like chemotaxis protein